MKTYDQKTVAIVGGLISLLFFTIFFGLINSDDDIDINLTEISDYNAATLCVADYLTEIHPIESLPLESADSWEILAGEQDEIGMWNVTGPFTFSIEDEIIDDNYTCKVRLGEPCEVECVYLSDYL